MGTKEHIMDAAMKLFSEKGFEATTVRDIVSMADVNVALINYHFGSKEGLLKQLIETRAKLMQVRIKEISENTELSEIQKINLIIEHYVEKLFTHHAFHKVLIFELFSSTRESLHQDTLEIFSGNSKIIESIINSGIQKKIFNQVDAAFCFPSMIGPMHHIMHSKTLRVKLFSVDSQVDPILEPLFKQRVINHIQCMMKNHLLADK